ncbi:uncharacterized protein EMH_0013890 [Eimeria mitis]|uniref:Transmembrane protein n=1 Tax=Eimeria mitis TaxID=44415 RepID=U6K9I1_9EIME|nr:uncharacterized protein EMH_0013890 [Eimeria mitis]CDJ32837.1 hypothetical protein EMH_0013890 [Eimeria mitis]
MLPSTAYAAAVAYLAVSLPGLSTAVDPDGNGNSSPLTIENTVEDAVQEQILDAPLKGASPSIRRALGVGLVVALATTLFLLLKCIQRLTSSQEAGGATRRRLADKDKEQDECDKLEEAIGGGGEESEEDEELAAIGGAEGQEDDDATPTDELGQLTLDPDRYGDDPLSNMDDGFHRTPTPDPFDDGTVPTPNAGQPLPEPEPAVTLTKKEAEERAAEMQEVTDLIAAGMEGGSSEAAGGRTLRGLLNQAYYCRQKNKNAEFGEDVPQELIDRLKDLVKEMEKLLYVHRGVGSKPDGVDPNPIVEFLKESESDRADAEGQ